jgi:hypothetical protein
MPMSTPDGTTAAVTLRDLGGTADTGPDQARTVEATITIDPPEVADDAEWLTVTAWQGAEWQDQDVVLDRLERVDERTWRTTEPIPVSGSWKAIIRLHHGRTLAAAPIYLPEDEAIPAPEVPAEQSFTREFVADKDLLQREQTGGSAWLEWAAYLTVLAIGVAWVGSVAWGLGRLQRMRPAPRTRSMAAA